MNAISGVISIGSVIFYIRSLDYFTSSLTRMLSTTTYLNEFGIKINDLVKLFEMEPMYKDGHIKLGKLDKAPKIEFKNVSFKYPGSEKYIYQNLNLKINSGERVAIVGHNGAGKTTLVKLIAKIYPANGGEILINGINLSDIKTSEWYKNLGVLFQEFNFYGHLTAKENIYLGNPSEPMDENSIVEAAINADADEFIMEYKKGYDQLLSERYKDGIRPSTGQKQKIAIAKFFYRNAPVAIFDEPTAAIDAVSEYKIFNKIYSFFEKKTVVIISHRFSTVRNADRIIVIEKGKILEEGSHADLLGKNGAYAHAFRLQAEGYRTEVSTLRNHPDDAIL
jgi:ATP-binding cassette subfamily B protein